MVLKKLTPEDSMPRDAVGLELHRLSRPLLLFLLLGSGSFFCSGPAALAQDPPGTDIWGVELMEEGGRITLGDPVRITDRQGYDNQPHFGPGGAYLLYTSIDGSGQADIHRYDFGTGNASNLTRTAPESEYSATIMPGDHRFSVIRVEADSTQRLWSFDLSGDDPKLVLTSIAPVGYHAWVDESTLALFVLGSPATLQIADTGSQEARVLATDIGRSLHKIPGRPQASFLQWETRDGERVGVIKSVDPRSGEIEEIAAALPGNEHYAWTPGGTLLMGSGSKLYALQPGTDAAWREIADLADAGLQGITRLAVSPDGTRLAVVGNR